MEQWYWYQPLTEGRVRMLRVFGRESQVVLPQKIASGMVAEIGDYCFSEKEPRGDYGICSEMAEFHWDSGGAGIHGGQGALLGIGDAKSRERESLRNQAFARMCQREGLHPLAGKNVAGVELPDSVTKIGNLAFYQCGELERIVLGMGEMEVGSDAFMNCRRLSSFYFRGSPGQVSCLKQILAQRSGETAVYFTEGEQIQAALLYPEYFEGYDLIGPAHIFQLNIQGEGFRARQCFQKGAVDFGAYDRIFSMEWGEESVHTLCRMACFRLQYPWCLQEREQNMYQAYVSENIDPACAMLVKERNLAGIQALYDLGLLKPDSLQGYLERAVSGNWTEGVRHMLSMEEGEKRGGTGDYVFEDF